MPELSQSVGARLTVDKVCTFALRFASLINMNQMPTPDDLRGARELLGPMLDSLESEGALARTTMFHNLQLAEDQQIYMLPETILEVRNPAMRIDAGQDPERANSEMVIHVINEETWNQIGNKSAKASPQLVYPHKGDFPIELRFWPIPDRADIVRLMTQRRMSDADDGNAVFDLDNFWMDTVIYGLANRLAEAASLPESKIARLGKLADTKLKKAKAKAQSPGADQAELDHRTGY